MTHYNSANVKLSNFQLDESKSAIKNETAVILGLSSIMIGVILMLRLIFLINYNWCTSVKVL